MGRCDFGYYGKSINMGNWYILCYTTQLLSGSFIKGKLDFTYSGFFIIILKKSTKGL